MTPTRLTVSETARRGKARYEEIRAALEIPENIGKLVSIDVETGAYEIGDDRSLDAPQRLQARHPGAAIYTHRIGYNAVYALGGALERVVP